MPRARAIVRRRKSVRNIRKITRTMQMVATVKFQRALRHAASIKNYAVKLRELITDLSQSVEDLELPLLRQRQAPAGRSVILIISSNRGLAGAYNANVLRTALAAMQTMQQAGQAVELHTVGRKAAASLNFKGIPIARRYSGLADQPPFAEVAKIGQSFMDRFEAGELDLVQIAYTNFITASNQRPEMMTLLPLAPVADIAAQLSRQAGEQHAPAVARGLADEAVSSHPPARPIAYDFSPSPREILEDLLPQAVKMLLFQCFLDATTSENVARMVAMKSATDSADKMIKALTMRYNRARQSQITTELSEIMGAVEAMR